MIAKKIEARCFSRADFLTPVFFRLRALIPRNGLDMLIDVGTLLKKSGLYFKLVIGRSIDFKSLLCENNMADESCKYIL